MTKRRQFGKLPESWGMPNLIEIQIGSYEEFLQGGVPVTKRKNVGLQAVLLETFPIESFDGRYRLEFVSYTINQPKYTVRECLSRGLTYAGPLKVKLRLVSKKESREQEVYLGDVPLMTETATFVVNGDERVVVSQLHRSPGVSFEERFHTNGKRLYSARIIPYRGAWVEFEFDINDCIYVYLDRKKKFLTTTFLRAIGFSEDADIIKAFCDVEEISLPSSAKSFKEENMVAAETIKGSTGGNVITAGQPLTPEVVSFLIEAKIPTLKVTRQPIAEITKTLERDCTKNRDEAVMDIYKKLRPGDPPTTDSAKTLLERLVFDNKRYDLGRVGRFMLNRKLGMNSKLENRTLDKETIVQVIKRLIKLKEGEGDVDDIDHLGNRRVRTIGELLQNQFRVAMARVEKSARERMNLYDPESMMPNNLVNSKLVSTVVKDFFGRSQLSQFMDQTNPLAELAHKRRLSALGPGGLSRERAGFDVRDVHYSHYGRVCPIETPEGPNIGLIASLSTYARVNEYGFVETPYRKVENDRVTKKIEYLTADLEDNAIIAQANARIDKDGNFLDPLVSCRQRGNFPKVPPKEIHYMDVTPKQLVSVAASLIPFLEHDDANRALMGSNMQRQAVPLLFPESPTIGTGMEHRAAKDSGAVVVARSSGTAMLVESDKIMIGKDVYPLLKFQRSNADTCLNHRPLVKVGQKVKEGDVIADGAATKDGELSLGRNVLVAFMPWRGYNFEDAILISERLVKDDVYTSVHIGEFEIEARDTRLGPEEITRDIPNVSEEALRDLDEQGIVRIGAEVEHGDILIGKVSPKSETELSPEEKLLRAIFGEKAGDVRDASLTVPPGTEGIVVDVKVFTRKDSKTMTKNELAEEQRQIGEIRRVYRDQITVIEKERDRKLGSLLWGKALGANLVDPVTERTLIAKGKVLRKKDIKKIMRADLENIVLVERNEEAEEDIRRFSKLFTKQIEDLIYEEEREMDKIKRGDELPPGVIKKVVVYIASKKKISVGDKIAGRHGNKGVIAKILPAEDMPFLPDGSPVDMVLNPLGVPSRMNVGQILELHLGWAAHALGYKVATPVFDGSSEEEIKVEMRKAGLPMRGKSILYDGLTGEPFEQEVAVGMIYMMKLAHLVDDKIHARSIGPYSLVTQQPLGGKAQFGGQRFGEMEVWALEAYGAAYTLQELLTVKSDDVVGRTKTYEAIVKGENTLQAGTPESFNVLIKELQSLCLDIRTERRSS